MVSGFMVFSPFLFPCAVVPNTQCHVHWLQESLFLLFYLDTFCFVVPFDINYEDSKYVPLLSFFFILLALS